MNSHGALVVLAFSLIACRMDNPAFEGGDDDVGDVGDGSGDTVDSGEEGEGEGESANTSTNTSTNTNTNTNDGMDDVDTSVDETNDTSGTTDGDCPPGGVGSCHVCNMNGVCVPDAGQICSDAVLHCSDYLFGAEESTCYALAETSLLGTCTEGGECMAPSPDICPFVKGEVHFACDPVCVTNSQGCIPGALASNVDMMDMCVVDGESPDCQTFCSNEFSSAIEHYACVLGECMSQGAEICGAYACSVDFEMCFMSCETDAECAQPYACEGSDCVLP